MLLRPNKLYIMAAESYPDTTFDSDIHLPSRLSVRIHLTASVGAAFSVSFRPGVLRAAGISKRSLLEPAMSVRAPGACSSPES